MIRLQVRRHFCDRKRCSRKTFVEQVPGLSERHRRSSNGPTGWLPLIAIELGGRPAARLCRRLRLTAGAGADDGTGRITPTDDRGEFAQCQGGSSCAPVRSNCRDRGRFDAMARGMRVTEEKGPGAAGNERGDHVDFRGGLFTGPVLGEGVQNNHYAAARPRASFPHQVGVIPPQAGCFQSRAEADRLHRALMGGQAAVLVGQDTVRGQILVGMGGVGKTQLAADYARTVWQAGEVDVIVWIAAGNATAAASGYAQAGIELLGADPEQAAQAFLAWLEPRPGQDPVRWLVVLDDVTEPGDLNGLWPPASPHGRTLVTTRRRDAALTSGRHVIEVGLFTAGESLHYLTAALAGHGRAEPDEELAALSDDLGHLPLALSQAVAYLIDAGINTAAYRQLLADRATKLADATPEENALPDGQTRTVAAAWALSIDRADTLRPAALARPLLQLAAFLAPHGILGTVLTSPPVRAFLADHLARQTGSRPAPRHAWWPRRRSKPPAPVTVQETTGALRALHRLSLISHTPDTPHQAVRVHQLIQRTVRDALAPTQHHHIARTAADALIAVWPDIENDTVLAQTLRASTDTLTSCAEAELHQPDAHTVLYQAGRSLGQAGQATAARDHYHRLAHSTTTYLGPDHPNTLVARGNLARWQSEAGNVAGAITAFAELLNAQLRVLGPDHPDTFTTRHNLAHSRGEAGDPAGAATAYAELLDDRLRVLGPDHPDTLMSRNNLAGWRGEAGDALGAATAFTGLLNDQLRVLGPDHPDTLVTRSNLARLRNATGDAAGAVIALTALLDDQMRVLGPEHPDAFTTRHNLAQSRGQAGDPAGAATAFTELLDDRLRVLGPDHPHTLITRYNHAYWRGRTGSPIEAVVAFAELFSDHRRVLGPDHPHTLATRRQLAYWQQQAAGDGRGPGITLP